MSYASLSSKKAASQWSSISGTTSLSKQDGMERSLSSGLNKASSFNGKKMTTHRPGQTTGDNSGSKGNLVKMDDPIGTCTVTCGALNVRNGAGTNYARIGGLTHGKTVQVYEYTDGWLRIGYGTGYGWIASKYTDYKEPLPDGAIFEVVITGDVNVRTGAGKNNQAIGVLHEGEKVVVYEEKNGWYRTVYNGQTGWFHASYGEVIPGTETGYQPEPTPDPDPDPDPGDDNDKVVAAGKRAEQAARNLMQRTKDESWQYSQDTTLRKTEGYYDCSSFCNRCWSAAGYDFNWANSGRMGEIIDNGNARVETGSNQNAIAGDILFFSLKNSSNYLSISHVAIATDNPNEMIDPGTKSVSISNPNGSYYGGKIVMVGRPGLLMK